MESRILKKRNKPYDASALILSEKQLAYAAAGVITNGRKAYNSHECGMNSGQIGDGGGFACALEVMLDGLGAVPNTWDQENKTAIENDNAPLDANIVYNFNNSTYEVNGTIEYEDIHYNALSESDKKVLMDTIKGNIIKYGGGAFDIDIAPATMGMYRGQELMIIGAYDSQSFSGGGHSMQVIGWDDDYEYKICKHDSGYIEDSCPDDYFTGRGVWIIKNSWEGEPIVLAAYDNFYGYDVHFYTDISERNWDNYHQLDSDFLDENTRLFFFKEDEYITEEVITKIKIKLWENTNNKIYYSENGDDNYVLLGKIDTRPDTIKRNGFDEDDRLIGYYYLDLSSKSYRINNDSKFKVVDGMGNIVYDFRVYTNNVDNSYHAKMGSTSFNKNKDIDSTYTFELSGNTRNINDNEELIYKIVDPNGNYVKDSVFDYDKNKIYAHIISPVFTLNSSSFKDGIYIIETYYDNHYISSSTLKLIDSATEGFATYTATYDFNGGSGCKALSKTVYADEEWGEFCTPTRKDYTFDGWWTAKTGGTKVTEEIHPESDITIYAHWLADTPPINPKTGNSISSVVVIVLLLGVSSLVFVYMKRKSFIKI